MRTIMLVSLLLALGNVAQANVRYVGYAYDAENGELVYTEVHQEVPTGGEELRLETAYRNGAGETFATREVLFGAGGSDPRPDFEMTDSRIDYVEGVREEGRGYRVYKDEAGEREEKLVQPGKRPLVVDAGFDRFVQEQWEQLQAGEFARFDFVNCDRLSLIALRLSKRGSRETEFGTVTDFEMEPNNWLIRLLVDPIVITYRDEDQTLLEYTGISNVKRPNGSNYVVRIFFPPEERTRVGLTAERDAAVAP